MAVNAKIKATVLAMMESGVLNPQQEVKCFMVNQEIYEGDVGLIITENCPPMHWSLGRITALELNNGLVRVVIIQTAHNIIKRLITKVCPLPKDKQITNWTLQQTEERHVNQEAWTAK